MKYEFTAHAEYIIKKRVLTKQEIIEAIKYSDITQKRYGKYYAQKNIGRGKIEIVFERRENYIKIITVYWL